MWTSCVWTSCVKEAAGGGGIQNQKQEPHTKMWGNIILGQPQVDVKIKLDTDSPGDPRSILVVPGILSKL